MAAAAGREAIRSHPATPDPLISDAAMGRTEGINPAFGDIGDLGAGIAQIGVATTQQPQPQRFGTGINPVFVCYDFSPFALTILHMTHTSDFRTADSIVLTFVPRLLDCRRPF